MEEIQRFSLLGANSEKQILKRFLQTRKTNTFATSVMLYGSETWSVKEKDVIRLGYYNARMIRQMCNVRSEDRISTEEQKWTKIAQQTQGVNLTYIRRSEDVQDVF